MSAETRVLYIDDDEGLRRLAARALGRRGYDVCSAAAGEEGLARLRAERFDVVALDHYMPGRDGMAILKAALEEFADPPPIVYVTGAEETSIAVAALKAGAADYVVKSAGEHFFDLLDSAFRQAIEQVRLRRKHAEAEAALQASNERLQALLREVNHRVANSLQMVSAFVQMQASALEDEVARNALRDTERRIEAIGQVHRRLYTSGDVDTVDMAAYLDSLVSELQATCSTPKGPRHLALAVDPIRLPTDKAVALGVIVNELVTNACKYAYPADKPGEVRIALTRLDEVSVRLVVEDDGPGLNTGADPRGTGLGKRLIRAMAASLDSEVEYDPAHAGVRALLPIRL